MREAEMERTEHGLRPKGEGWYVVNAAETVWRVSPVGGRWCRFEGETPFEHLGVNLHVLEPGKPACLYHGENQQEGFLVLKGECILVVEGEERRLRALDYFHAPPWTEHVFVGAGEGPCVVLMMGARLPEERLIYPVNETARRHGASVEADTKDPEVAYASWPRSMEGKAPEGLRALLG